jgi:hypothetical protein
MALEGIHRAKKPAYTIREAVGIIQGSSSSRPRTARGGLVSHPKDKQDQKNSSRDAKQPEQNESHRCFLALLFSHYMGVLLVAARRSRVR